MPFRSIVGHVHVVDLLTRAIARDSLPPSLILSGPEGVGKRTVALALAQVLNCTKRTATGDACGECAACRRIHKRTHPDVLTVDQKGIHPEVIEFEVKEGAAIINIDVARKVIKLAGFRPYEGRRRVVIIDPADAMERPVQSAFLKVLEEPPETTTFVLVTAHPDALYATIRSRCPQIRFGALTVAEITQVLTRQRGLPERDARAAAIVAAGSVSRAMEAVSEQSTDARAQALGVLREAASSREPRRLLDAMRAILGMEKKGPSAAAEREQVALSLQALSSLLRDVTMIGAGGDARELANADLETDLEEMAGSFGRARVMRAFVAVDRAIAALGSNANPKVVVDWLAFQM